MARMQQNGRAGSYDVLYGTAEKIFVGVSIALLSATAVSIFNIYLNVATINVRLASVEKQVEKLTDQAVPTADVAQNAP